MVSSTVYLMLFLPLHFLCKSDVEFIVESLVL